MKTSYRIFQDWKSGNSQKGKVVLLFFRLACLAKINVFVKVLLLPYLVFYKIFIEWILGIELPYQATIGQGLRLFHGQSLVVHRKVIIGNNCTLRHSTTIGNVTVDGECPRIGNNVEIGANVCLLGEIEVGDNVVIGAGSVVVKSIPSNSIVVGNPARVIKNIILS